MAAVQPRWAAAVAVTMLAVAASTAQAQVVSPASAPAPAGGIDSACLTSLLNMSDCLPYVQNGSTARRPDKPCCPELAGLVDSNPVCLCELLSGAADSYGIAIDYSRALALPGICHVATPPVSTCTALGYNVHLGPSAAPMSGSPSPSPSGEGPQFTGTSPFASPRTSPNNHAARRFAGGDLITLAALPLAAVVAGML